MEPRLSLVTLGVSDLARSAKFYGEVLGFPRLSSPPTIAFFQLGPLWLALYPRQDLAADVSVSATGRGFRGFTLSHNVRSEGEVDTLLREVAAGGAKIVKPAQRADWGGYSGYFADPDGFLWEVAFNPHFPIAGTSRRQ
jgi:catechol 2,3-dioxygenase-like lactoylglutathione lyase family enzyme